MVKLTTNGKVEIEMLDENNEPIVSENDVLFEISKKDEGAVTDIFSSSGVVEIKTDSDGQKINFMMNISDLLRCLKFLENWYG